MGDVGIITTRWPTCSWWLTSPLFCLTLMLLETEPVVESADGKTMQTSYDRWDANSTLWDKRSILLLFLIDVPCEEKILRIPLLVEDCYLF
ncbi:hypothetical protein HanIR_Chr06g0285051 [Helianthus annuus]|nr:hypothetical protein HanIR_Chr06g0285051 [Helianthus annuus]